MNWAMLIFGFKCNAAKYYDDIQIARVSFLKACSFNGKELSYFSTIYRISVWNDPLTDITIVSLSLWSEHWNRKDFSEEKYCWGTAIILRCWHLS